MSGLRFALRQLRKSPGFSLTVVLTLALGIGAATAVFSLVEGVLLRPLPFRDPQRLVLLGDRLGDGLQLGVTAPEVATYVHANEAFRSMGAFTTKSWELSGGPQSESVEGARLTAGVFPTLGVEPAVGRVFTRQEDEAVAPVAVLSYALWLRRYHLDPNIVGSTITLSRKNYTIIGVMPRSFEFPVLPGRIGQAQLWVPMSYTPDDLSPNQAGVWGTHLVGRLKDGVTVTQAALEADRIARQIMRNFPPDMAAIRIRGDVIPLHEAIVTEVRPLLRTLFLAVCIVLLIACANVATLMLVRSLQRRREYALRLAIGARAAVILRECCSEGLLLSVAGGLLGLGLAALALHTAVPLLPESMPRIASISVDAGVASFAVLVAIVTGLLCSVAPAWAGVRINLVDGLKEDVRSAAGSGRQSRLRSVLVVGEIAIATVLLTTSLAFLRSYQKMLAVDPGFRPDHVLVAGYRLPAQQYPDTASLATFTREVVSRLAAQPGTLAVGLANTLPDTGGGGRGGFTIEGISPAQWKLRFAPFIETYGDYFGALGISLAAGRTFTARDRSDAPLVCIVDQSMANHEWPGQNPIGKRIHLGNPKRSLPWATVVGVVHDVHLDAPDQPAGEQWYFPMEQPAIIEGAEAKDMLDLSDGFIALRSTLPPAQMVRTVRTVVAGIDSRLVLDPIQPMSDAMSAVEAPRRFNTGLISVFALIALLLAATGIYAAMAFGVSQRTREIAIRMALGASPGNVVRLVLGAGMRLAVVGSALGLAGSMAASRMVEAFLFGVRGGDPLLYAASAVGMLLLALLASAVPAWRATAADPVRDLRSA